MQGLQNWREAENTKIIYLERKEPKGTDSREILWYLDRKAKNKMAEWQKGE